MKVKVTQDTFGFVERAENELYSVRIKKGRFKGVIFTYGEVKLNEDKNNDQLSVNFDFIVNEGNRRYPSENLQNNLKFKDFLGKILIYILEKEYGTYEEYRKTDIKENM